MITRTSDFCVCCIWEIIFFFFFLQWKSLSRNAVLRHITRVFLETFGVAKRRRKITDTCMWHYARSHATSSKFISIVATRLPSSLIFHSQITHARFPVFIPRSYSITSFFSIPEFSISLALLITHVQMTKIELLASATSIRNAI